MHKLIAFNAWLGRLTQYLGMCFLLAIMLVTITDIITRTLYSVTAGAFPWFMKGSVELVSYGLLLALLAGFAGLVERAQIIVDVLNAYFSDQAQQMIIALSLICYALLGLIMSIGFVVNTLIALEYGEMTQDLRIPLTYIYIVAMVFTLILTLRATIEAIIIMSGRANDKHQATRH